MLNDSANVGSAHCCTGAVSYMLISVFIIVFSLGCFLNGTVCIICVCLRVVCTVNLNERDCKDMEWHYVTEGQAIVPAVVNMWWSFRFHIVWGMLAKESVIRLDIRRIIRPTKSSVRKL